MGSFLTTYNFPGNDPFDGPAWIEDFNYGYPYRNNKVYPQYGQLYVTPAEFEYSTTAHTTLGTKTSTSYRRRDWSLHQFEPKTEPFNFDQGFYAKAPYGMSNYYMLWPLMTWGEVQVMSINVMLDDYGACVWHHAFDGHIGDKFHVFVNNKWWTTFTNSMAHGWTGDQIWLAPGLSRISWVFEAAAYVPTKPSTKGNIISAGLASTPPTLLRHLRMAYISVTHTSTLPQAKTVYSNVQVTGTMGAGGLLKKYGKSTFLVQGNLGNQQKTGLCFMTGQSSLVTNALTMSHQSGFVELQGVGTMTIVPSVKSNHAADDGGWHLSAEGQIRVETPINTPQNIVTRQLQLVAPTMRNPIIIQGRPYHPSYFDIASSTASTSSTYSYTDPVSPSDVNKQLTVPPTYRWVATDIPGADGTLVSSWPCRTAGGPAWSSANDYRPTVHPHTHFSANGDFGLGSYVTYSRAVHFDNEMCEHMWMSMPVGNRVSNYTWQIVVLLGPTTPDRWNHIMDAGTGNATAFDQTALRNGQHIPVAGETANPRCHIVKTNTTYIVATATNPVPASSWPLMFNGPEITTRPMIITASLKGMNSGTTLAVNSNSYAGRQNFQQNATTPVGFLLGRSYGFADQWNGSSMSVLEVNYWNRALTTTEWNKNVKYLSSLYQFNKYR